MREHNIWWHLIGPALWSSASLSALALLRVGEGWIWIGIGFLPHMDWNMNGERRRKDHHNRKEKPLPYEETWN